MKKTVIISGGGTGGHLSPGIALYEELKKMGYAPLFLAGSSDLKYASIKEVDPVDLLLYGAPPVTKNPFKLPVFVLKFFGAVIKARRYIRDSDAAAIVGMGGYVSAPAIIAAITKKIPVFLCEQNAIPGKVTLFFEKKARKIYATFPESVDYIQNREAFVHSGNPIRKSVISKITAAKARERFNLGHMKKVLLVIGGSQGALRLNELIFGLKKKFPEKFSDTGIIWSTGGFSYEKYREAVLNQLEGGSVYISPFIERVGEAYAAADFAISRSGAGVMVELAAMGVPSLLIPYPHAAMNHQDKNADYFVEGGAALKMGDQDAVPEKAADIIFDIIGNPRVLKRMSEKALELAKPDASREIIEDILKEINS